MVLNGMIANQTTFNTGFVSRTAAATSTAAILSLLNTAIASGASVNNLQALLNKIIEGLGTTGELDAAINDYASNNYVVDGQSRKEAIETLDAQLGDTQADLDIAEANIVSALADIATLEADVNTINNLPSTFAGNKTFTNDVTVNGNMTVNGTTTTFNSTTVDSVDPNVTFNKTGDDTTSEGSGFTVDRTGTKGSFVYQNALAARFKVGDLGAEAEVATVSHTQTFTNKTLTSPIVNGGTFTTVSLVTPEVDIITATEQGATPSTPAAGKRKLYPKADGFYQLDSAGLETKVGSGSGSGGAVNLIPDGDAEQGIASYVEGSYAAASRPAGTFTPSAGTGALELSVTTTDPINTTKSFLITKSAGASRQGRAVERTITLDREYQTKVLNMRIKFSVVSGTFVAGSSSTDSSMIWYIGEFNGTTWTYTEPSSFKALSNGTLVDYVDGTFQVKSDTTQIKLISYVAEAANSAWALMCEFSISPSTYAYGTPITAWQAYTPTFVGLGTVTAIAMKWRQVGESYEVIGTFNCGTVTAATAYFNLPNNAQAALGIGTGVGQYGTQGGAGSGGVLVWNPADNKIYFGSSNWQVLHAGTQLATGGINTVQLSIPIQGLGAVTRISDGYEGRIVTAKATRSVATAIPNNVNTKVPFDVVSHDDVAGFTSGTYTVRVKDKYRISGHLNTIGTTATFELAVYLYINGAVAEAISNGKTGTVAQPHGLTYDFQRDLKAGDTVEIYAFQNSGASLDLRGNNVVFGLTSLSIERISGPQTISASEPINCSYSSSAGGSIAIGDTLQSFSTRLYDSHGAWSGSVFTAPVVGKYRVSVTLLTAAVVLATNQGILINVYKNGTLFRRVANMIGTGANNSIGLNGTTTADLLAGETLSIYAASSVSTNQFANTAFNFLTVEKVG